MNTLYVNDGTRQLRGSEGAPPGSAGRAWRRPASAPAWFDFDNDGWLDSARGQRRRRDHRGAGAARRSVSAAHVQPACSATCETADSRMSPTAPARCFELADVGRGAAFGDVDNDGDIDVVVGNASGPAAAADEQRRNRSHWLGLRLVGAGEVGGRGPRHARRAGRGRPRRAADALCAARAPMAATRRPTTRACSLGSARRRRPCASASPGPAAAARSGPAFRRIGGRR